MSDHIYGRQPVRECLRARRRHIHRLLVAEGVKERGVIHEILGLAHGLGVPLSRVSRGRLAQISEANQGVALEVGNYPYATLEDIWARCRKQEEAPFLLVMDHLQDPHNLGSLMRSAEGAGMHGVLIPNKRAAEVTPAVVSASSGASEHMLVAQVTNLVRTFEALKSNGVWVVGLDSGPDSVLYETVDLNLPLALVVGAEGAGLSRLVRERCDLLIRLPMRGKIESLNASVAGGIAIYAALRARAFSGN